MRPSVRLQIDHLEDRQVPATFGVPWTDPMHLSVSFAPDGTSIGGSASNLFQTLSRLDPTGQWQRNILRAFQAWSAVANVNIGLVTDSGEALGSSRTVEGNDHFGTIRIAAKPLADGVLAIALPPDSFTAGTWTGEIIFNSNANLTAQKTDIFSVFLHEIGHALGLSGSTDPSSVMFQTIQGKRTALAASDVTAITKLYGVRTADINDADKSNGIIKEATRLKYSDDGDDAWTGTTPVVSYGDITKTTDIDFYSFRNLRNYTGPITFRVLSKGVSLLNPKVSVYDSGGRLLMSRTAAGQVGGADLAVTLPRAISRETYFIKVESASATEPFRVGRFGIAATLDSLNKTPLATTNSVLRGHNEMLQESDLQKLFRPEEADQLFEMDDHTDDSAGLAERMEGGNSLGTVFNSIGSIQDAADVDFHRVRAPFLTSSGLSTGTITVTPFEINGVMPAVQLLDSLQQPVPLSVLTKGAGVMVLQATGLRAGTDYYIRVSSAGGAAVTGNYNINVRFSAQSTSLETFANGSLPATGATSKVFVAQPQLFHFLLSTSNGVGVTLTLRDGANQVVFTLTSNGTPTSATPVILQPGEYRIQLTPTAGQPTIVTLKGASLSDPIGAIVIDPTKTPAYQTPGTPGSYTYPTGTVTTKPYLFSSLVL